MKHCALGERAVTVFKLSYAPPRMTIRRALSDKDDDIANSDQKRRQLVLCLRLKAALLKWVRECECYNMPVVISATIREKAAKVRKELLPHASPSTIATLTSISFSTEWLCKFQRHHKLTSKRVHSEVASANAVSAEEGRTALQASTHGYAKQDIYNIDETAYFYCTSPNRTVTNKRVRERKNPKKPLTVAITCNADGSFKLPLLFVAAAQRPRCFNGKTGEQLGLDYESAPKGWMNIKLFQNWTCRFSDDMRAENYHVLLLFDNASFIEPPSHSPT